MGLFDFSFSFGFGNKPEFGNKPKQVNAETARIEVGARRRDVEKVFGPPVSSRSAPGGGKTSIYAIGGQNLSVGHEEEAGFGGISLNVGMKEVTKISTPDGGEIGSMRLSITYGPDDRITEIKPV